MKRFNSILYGEIDREPVNIAPSFFSDLQLDYLLKIIEHNAYGYPIRTYFYTMPSSIENIQFRQSIYLDLQNEELSKQIQKVCLLLFHSRRSSDYSIQCEEKIQTASYHLEAAVLYMQALLDLQDALKSEQIHSEGLKQLRVYLNELMNEYEKNGLVDAILDSQNYLNEMKYSLIISNDKFTVSDEVLEQDDWLNELKNILQTSSGQEDIQNIETSLSDLFPNALENSYLETIFVKLLQKSKPDIFKKILEFQNQYSSFYSTLILKFEKEVQFYLSFIAFKEKTNQFGYLISDPKVQEHNSFRANGVYDLALVWKNAIRHKPVISNDFNYPEHPSFFVVTGPNQGGKTTFARAVGQAVYFSLLGVGVNASSFSTPFFTGLSTHFEVEESVKSNSGKLKEEIDRLAPMMKHYVKNQLIILNELFTTATTHDALVMGKKVMKHFLTHGCYGIYVTHIQELAEETEQIISMVAQIEDSESQERTYKICPMEAQGYGYSDQLVKKYELTYKDLMRRLP